MTDETESRKRFEIWISGTPYERGIERYAKSWSAPWSGQYCDYTVELAWEAWQAALNQESKA